MGDNSAMKQPQNKLLTKALEDAQRVLYFVAHCHQCGACRSRALNCLGYEVNPVLKTLLDEKVSRLRKTSRKRPARAEAGR